MQCESSYRLVFAVHDSLEQTKKYHAKPLQLLSLKERHKLHKKFQYSTNSETVVCKFPNAECNNQHEASAWQVQVAFGYHKPNSKENIAGGKKWHNDQNERQKQSPGEQVKQFSRSVYLSLCLLALCTNTQLYF